MKEEEFDELMSPDRLHITDMLEIIRTEGLIFHGPFCFDDDGWKTYKILQLDDSGIETGIDWWITINCDGKIVEIIHNIQEIKNDTKSLDAS